MAQIIKHRRGSIDTLSSATAKKGELIIATGSVGNMSGPWVFVGETEGSAGAFRGLSKIYQGAAAPNLTVGTWGSTLNGTPFYSSNDKTLYILSNAGNTDIDLTGNIEGNTISGLTINQLNGDLRLDGDLFITGNTYQTGSHYLTGDVILSGSINIGDNLTGDTINFGGEVNSHILPTTGATYDLGQSGKTWNNVWAENAHFTNIDIGSITLNSLALPGDLTVSGTTTLSGSVYNDNLTENRVVIVGGDGLLEDDANFTFDGSTLKIGDGDFEVETNGNTRTSGSVTVVSGVVTDNINGITQNTNSLHLHGGTFGAPDVELTSIGQISLFSEGGGSDFAINMTGSAYVSNDLNVTGSVNVLTNLNVSGAFTVSSGSVTTLGGDLFVSGNLEVLGSQTNVHLESKTVEIGDNIILLNAYSPFERYAGMALYDSGSTGESGSFLWDSLNNYFLMDVNGDTSKVIGTTTNTLGNENSLTDTYFPIATGDNTIGNSLLRYSGTTLTFNTNKFTVDSSSGDVYVDGNVRINGAGGSNYTGYTSEIVFKNSDDDLGFVSSTDTQTVTTQLLGYQSSDGTLVFSSLIDGGSY